MGSSFLKKTVLSRRLVIYIILCSLFFILLITSIQLFVEYRKGLKAVQSTFEYVSNSYIPGIAASTYKLDKEQLKYQLQGLLNLPDIQYAEIFKTKKGKKAIIISAGDNNASRDFIKKFPLKYTGKKGKTEIYGILLVAASYKNVYKRLWGRAFAILKINGLGIFLSALCILLIVQKMIARHLTTMSNHTRQLEMDNLDCKLYLNRSRWESFKPDELDRLVNSINHMQTRLIREIEESRQTKEALQESEDRYRQLFEESPISLWEEDLSGVKKYLDRLRDSGISDFRTYFETHPETVRECAGMVRIVDVNKATLEIFQAESKEELFVNLVRVFSDKSYDVFEELLISLTLAEGKYLFKSETVNKTLKGNEIYVDLQLTVASGYEDTWAKVLVSLTDITKRRQVETELEKYRQNLEEQVNQRTKEIEEKTEKVEKSRKALTYLLEDVNNSWESLQKVNMEYAAANKELKEFAYIVSHDLKAPLRAISQLTQWISEDYSEAFDNEGKMQMDLILKRVKRMDGLIDGILSYSRVGRIREKQEYLDLNLLVNDVIDNIVPPDHFKIIIENKLPVVLRDSIRMEQVFQNLIGNAIKFMDKGEGIIKVGCTNEDAFWKFSISDNGPGIDKRYHDKIFRIFQTLTSRDEHESTGIGLTLVKKIIELYGGSVWVKSQTGQGATFFFTLPKKGEKYEKL